MRPARRLDRIPPYLFAELSRKREAAKARGVDVIDLGIGDPDRPTPPHIIEALARASHDPSTHRYPHDLGAPDFRQAASRWFDGRFGVDLDPEEEILGVIGSKEGLAHLVWAFIDPGDIALVPDPAYPVYMNQTLLAGGDPFVMPLEAERGFLPDLDAIPADVARKARVMFISYPNNPTGGTADLAFFEQVVAYAKQHDILVCHDAAYTEVVLGDYVAPSILEVPGARETAIEFHSLSKPFNMTGWRVGFAAGGAAAVKPLAAIKNHTDSGQFTAIQRAGITALLETPDSFHAELKSVYERRADVMVKALADIGLDVQAPRGTFYLWVPVPDGYSSEAFCAEVLEQCGVLVSPGNAYGRHGQGFFRISLTASDERLVEAGRRLRSNISFG